MTQSSRNSTASGDLPFGDRSPSGPPLQSPPAPSIAAESTPPFDPRLRAFTQYLKAVDECDAPAAIAAARELRRLGYSVVATGKASAGGPSWR